MSQSSPIFSSPPLLPSSPPLPSPPLLPIGAMVHSVFGHRGIVSCIAYCPERGLCGTEGCGFIASGSHDATVLLWRWNGKQYGVLNPTSKDLGSYPSVCMCMGVCVCVCAWVCACVCAWVCMCGCMCVYVWVHVVCMCVYVWVHVCACVGACVCMCGCMYVHVCVHVCVYVWVQCGCMCGCVMSMCI